MRTAVISDMHGNCIALDAVLTELDADPPDQIVCLGDVAQGGPQPAECVERLRALGYSIAQGNTDAWLGLGAPAAFTESISPRAAEVGEWSAERLGDDGRAFLDSLTITITAEIGDGLTLTGFHGSPRSHHDVLLPETGEDEFRAMLGDERPAVMAGGHTHLQQLRRADGTLFLNPGSVGAAYDRHQDGASFMFDPWAEFAMLRVERGRVGVEFRRLPFDVDVLLQAVAESGLPYGAAWPRQYGRG